MHIRSFRTADQPEVIALWEKCNLTRPWNDPSKDIARKMDVQAELFLVGVVEETLMASVLGGYEGHRGWINYLAVSPAYRGRGYGRALMTRIEELLVIMGCPKINIQVRATNSEVLEFYRALGYQQDDVVSLGKRLIADD